MDYKSEDMGGGMGRERHGSSTFYDLIGRMAVIHDKKSHDYASNQNPYGNYHFAGMLAKLFDNPDDAGFIGRIGEKIYRLANLENSGKQPTNETIEDTEIDICVITALWMASRKDRRPVATNQYARPMTDDEMKQEALERHIISMVDDMTPRTLENVVGYLHAIQNRNATIDRNSSQSLHFPHKSGNPFQTSKL